MPRSRVPILGMKDIANVLAENLGLSKKDAMLHVTETIEIIVKSLIDGKKVNTGIFCNFELKQVAEKVEKERERLNPRTGERFMSPARVIPAHRRLSVRTTKSFKNRIN